MNSLPKKLKIVKKSKKKLDLIKKFQLNVNSNIQLTKKYLDSDK